MFSASEVQNDDKKNPWDNGGVRERDHSMGVRREVLRGVHQIQLGVWGAL